MSEPMIILTVEQVCERLTISEPTLRRYTKNGDDFPRKIKIGQRRVGYLKADIEAYIARRYEHAAA